MFCVAFEQGGPGTVDAVVDVGVRGVMLAQGPPSGRCLPLASPLTARLQMLTDVINKPQAEGGPLRHRCARLARYAP
jgi:hypothetical protein